MIIQRQAIMILAVLLAIAVTDVAVQIVQIGSLNLSSLEEWRWRDPLGECRAGGTFPWCTINVFLPMQTYRAFTHGERAFAHRNDVLSPTVQTTCYYPPAPNVFSPIAHSCFHKPLQRAFVHRLLSCFYPWAASVGAGKSFSLLFTVEMRRDDQDPTPRRFRRKPGMDGRDVRPCAPC